MIDPIVVIVSIEAPPPAVSALHAHQPFTRPSNRGAEFRISRAVQGRCTYCGVIGIRIIGVAILEGPAARPDSRPLHAPVTFQVEYLMWQQPSQAVAGSPLGALATHFEQSVT